MTEGFTPNHAERSGTMMLPLPLAATVELFTPLGETHWVAGWHPIPRHPLSGLPVAGAVFLTSHGDDATTIWVMTHYDPAAGHLTYARITPNLAAGMVDVQCTATTPQTTTIQVTYRLTTLSATGNSFVAAHAQEQDTNWLAAWETAILQYLHH